MRSRDPHTEPKAGSTTEVGLRYGWKPRTVRRFVHTGAFPAFRVGSRGQFRIRFADVDAALEKNRVPVQDEDLDFVVQCRASVERAIRKGRFHRWIKSRDRHLSAALDWLLLLDEERSKRDPEQDESCNA